MCTGCDDYNYFERRQLWIVLGFQLKGYLRLMGNICLEKMKGGGRLEKGDPSAEARLVTEFDEESGIKVEVLEAREPWLYEIGVKNIIIVPYSCRALEVPEILVDEDGGSLHWVDKEEIENVFMPWGYKDTIWNQVPHKSYSIPAKFFFKIIPGYVEREYFVEVCVTRSGKEILRESFPHFYSPRDFIGMKLGEEYKDAVMVSAPVGIDYKKDMIVLNYAIMS